MRDASVSADAVVIGAGFAGLSAAVRLVAAGLKVVVLEQAPRLGGRASAFTDRATGERVDNGQHVLFGCYRETYAFLRAIGAEGRAPLQARLQLPMADAEGRFSELRCPNVAPPWHLVGGLLGWRALPLSSRMAALRVGQVIRRVRAHGVEQISLDVPDSLTVTAWLDRLQQPRAIRDWLWHPLALAALNQSPDVAAAAPFVRVVAQLFGPAIDDSSVGLANVPLDEMYAEPARAFIEARGGAVHVRTPARISLDAAGAPHVHTPLFDVNARYVISSVPWHAFGNLFDGAAPEPLRTTAANAAALGSSPIVTVNMWLDGPIMSHTFVGLVDAPIHWVFDKGAIVGEGATHLAVVTSGAGDFAAAGNDEVTRIVTGQLARTFPLARDRQVLRSVVVREHRATFSLAPGGPARPSVRTAVPGLFLAGDWTDTGLPATIEGAVVSGHQAADAVLAARAGG